MHQQVYDWVTAQAATRGPVTGAVLDIGSLDINGSLRPLFGSATHYHGIDLADGPGVDEVADAATWQPTRSYDVVLCAEVLEHAPRWRDIVMTMWRAAAPGAMCLVTCAAPPRTPHSAVDGLDVRPEEHYENVGATAMLDVVRTMVDGDHVASWSVTWAAARGDLYVRIDKRA